MILVSGARGNIGGELIRLLRAAGHPVRALSRDAARAKAALGPGVEIAVGDFAQPGSLPPALAGVEKAFFVADASPALHELGGHFFDAAKAGGVRHVVVVSSGTIQMEPPVAIGKWHAALEARVKTSGVAWTFLRPGNFASNSLRWAHTIKSQGKVFAPNGDGKSAPIDPRDIASVAFHALTGSGHESKIYGLSGPQALSPREQTAIIARVIGKPIEFVEVPEQGALMGMMKAGMPDWMANAILELLRGTSHVNASRLTTTVQDVTGQAPRSFETWAKDHARAFA